MDTMAGGTGQKLTYATTVVAGVASLAATLASIFSIWLQFKNYRKPLLQRYVVRILLMVPIYSISSWVSMISLKAAFWIDPIRDIYEAFTIYTFFQLLINYLGGERSLIIMTHGRAPVHHLWPLNHVLQKVDISDPHTFLAIKRGILQYTWLKPILGVSAIVMKATGTYKEGYISVTSGYTWSGIIYNISVTVSLYSLGLFWVCMNNDLKPFRPMPKFICIKLIIFASYWQGFLLSILVWLGVFPDNVQGYTPDNLAAAIQNALICCEMPGFAVAHWYAFSWKDYADNTISSARMPVKYAIRDAFGPRDLIEDSKDTFRGDQYSYRVFDSSGKIIAHEDSKSRLARLSEGMRYQRGGKGKYWIPKPGEVRENTPLLAGNGGPSQRRDSDALYGDGSIEQNGLDPDEEHLYTLARELEFGDWNYPVVTANEPSRERGGPSSYQQSHSRPSAYHANSLTRPKAPSKSASSDSRPAAPSPETVISKKKKKGKGKQRQHRPESPKDKPMPNKSDMHTTTEIPPALQIAYPEGTFGLQHGAEAEPHSPLSEENQEEDENLNDPRDPEAQEQADDKPSPAYDVEEQDEFRNVWGR